MTDSSNSIVYRPAFADEVARAASICEDSKIQETGKAACFVAIKDRPVERIVGAAFWRMLPCENGQTSTEAEFEWNVVASLVGSEEEQGFLKAIQFEVQDNSPDTKQLALATWLPEANALTKILQAAGFQQAFSRHLFQGEAAVWQQQLDPILAKSLPRDSSIVPPERDHFPALKKLLCGESVDQGEQLRPFELARGFQTADGESPSLFDPRCSGVLLANGQVVGTCLANVNKYGHLSIEGLAISNSIKDNHLLADHLLGHTLRGASELGAMTSVGYGVSYGVSYYVGTGDSKGLSAQLADRFQAQPCGTVHRYASQLESGSSH